MARRRGRADDMRRDDERQPGDLPGPVPPKAISAMPIAGGRRRARATRSAGSSDVGRRRAGQFRRQAERRQERDRDESRPLPRGRRCADVDRPPFRIMTPSEDQRDADADDEGWRATVKSDPLEAVGRRPCLGSSCSCCAAAPPWSCDRRRRRCVLMRRGRRRVAWGAPPSNSSAWRISGSVVQNWRAVRATHTASPAPKALMTMFLNMIGPWRQ